VSGAVCTEKVLGNKGKKQVKKLGPPLFTRPTAFLRILEDTKTITFPRNL
jgi:hypothetical protein